MTKTLTEEQANQFITRGWTKLPEAFPREVAVACQDFLWAKLEERGVLKNDRSTWHKPMEFIGENYDTPPFDACASQQLDDAFTDIVGDGRWYAQGKIGWWGHWPVNFAIGADQTWDVPADEWHIDTPNDGTYVTAPNQGSLAICLFSNLGPRGGGTLICEGSHQVALRYMRDNPNLTQAGFNRQCLDSHPYLRALAGRDAEGAALPGTDTGNARGADAASFNNAPIDAQACTERMKQFMDQPTTDDHGTALRVVEITGEPGDVFLAHPFMFHSPSFNHSGVPRFMCNRKTPLFEPLQLDRKDADYSILEKTAINALR